MVAALAASPQSRRRQMTPEANFFLCLIRGKWPPVVASAVAPLDGVTAPLEEARVAISTPMDAATATQDAPPVVLTTPLGTALPPLDVHSR